MEKSEDGVEEWKNLVMSPKGLNVFSGGEDSFGGDNENSKSHWDRKFESWGQGLNSSIAGGHLDVSKVGGSIAERRAAKFGFNAPKISTPRFRSSSLLPSPAARSPYLTIPAGISPTALLDSPILLPNSQPSPTTGTFSAPILDADSQMFVSTSSADAGKGFDTGSSSLFKPNTYHEPPSCFPTVEKQVSSAGGLDQSLVAHVDCQSFPSENPSVGFEFTQFAKQIAVNDHDASFLHGRKIVDGLTANANATLPPSHSNTRPCVQMQDKDEPSLEEDSGIHNSLDGNHSEICAAAGNMRTSEDGYNWRKYGQKQVKGSEYPRSYYKCTHPNCQVKKKVERSHDGQITEIIYKGAHNHPKPQPCRKSVFGSSSPCEMSDVVDGSGSCLRNRQHGCKDVKIGLDWRTDCLERTSSASVVTEASDPLSTTQGKPMGVFESAETPEFSSTMASYEDEEEDVITQGSFSLGDDNDNETDSKRRKKESCLIETTLGSRAVREPRVVVQIESEIDILEDGYRWRKYGQKVVKGNPNPRSYYKCTSAGCTVRKHVERASHNLKFVITTYEGKHNHGVPAARNSSHTNSGSGSLPPATNAQSALTLPRNLHVPKPESHVQDLPLHFERKMECNTDFLRPNLLGNFGGGTSPFYQMKLPILPNARPYGSYGLNNHHAGYPSGMLPAIPDISIPLPLMFPQSSNLTIANYGSPVRPLSSGQPLFGGHQPEDGAKLLKPKQEQGDESFYETGMHNIDHTNSSSSPLYNHILRTFPS